MKKKFLVFLMITAICTCSACGSSSSGTTDTSYVIEDGVYHTGTGYEIELTDHWTKTDNENTDLAFLYKDSTNDAFTESLNVIVQDLSDGDTNLESYKEDSVKQYNDLGYVIDECEQVTIGGKKSYNIISHTENGGTNIYCKQIFSVIDKHAYVFTFAAEKKDFDKLENEVTASFNSIKYGNYSLEEETSDAAE